MKRNCILLVAVWLTLIASDVRGQTPLGSEFIFQGQLLASGQAATSTADFQFALFDAETGGAQIASTIATSNVALSNGAFTVSLDFGSVAFQGDARWLEISVRSPAGAGGFTTLTPRQAMSATPNATYSLQTRGISVDQNGQVGIGTATPGRKLTVAGDMELGIAPADHHHLRLRGTDSDGFMYSGLTIGSFPSVSDGLHLGYNHFLNSAGSNQVLDPDAGTSRISLGAGTISLATQNPGTMGVGQSPTNRMVITPGGNVGIGTSSPQAMLHVDDDLRASEGRIGLLDTTLRIMGGRQSVSDEEHLIWKMGDYLTIVPNPGNPPGNVFNPELRMISPVTGDELAGFYRSFETGNGVMFADDKNFRAPNPADASTDIWYCCPEGPEAAMYVRGTGQLTQGRATIDLPDHFRNLASEPGMTVQLTPRSLESKGLATSKVSLAGIEVGELQGGTGNYEFDWRVEAVRKGWEDYKVIRPWLQSDEDPDKAWQNRLKHIEERRINGKPAPSPDLIPATRPN